MQKLVHRAKRPAARTMKARGYERRAFRKETVPFFRWIPAVDRNESDHDRRDHRDSPKPVPQRRPNHSGHNRRSIVMDGWYVEV